MQILGAVLLALVGAVLAWWARGGPFRAGPWPGLTPRGALMLVANALLLAAGVLVADVLAPRPVWLSLLSLGPLLLVTWALRMPGCAAAVCGAYLLPRSLLSVIDPRLPLPPLLLIPAMAFDLAVWLRWPDLARLWPWRRPRWRKRERMRRDRSLARLGVASAVFVLVSVGVFSATGTEW